MTVYASFHLQVPHLLASPLSTYVGSNLPTGTQVVAGICMLREELVTVWLPRIVDGDCLLTSPHQAQVTSHAPTARGSRDDGLVFIEAG
jgi:hypothetical protein